MRRMGIGLGIGINRSNYAQGIFNAYQSRVIADGGVTEAGACVDAVSGLLLTASLLLIPSGYKSGKAYAQIPTNGNGDLTWTRASTALRTNSSGLLESMGSGVPRLSYMYGSCPALLLEPQRTNLALYSEQFDNASWLKGNTTATANTTISPDGTTNADTITIQTTSGNNLRQNITVTANTTYTFSFYALRGTATDLRYSVFNFSGGSDIVAVTSYYSQTNSTTWSRITVTFTTPTGCTSIGVYPVRDTTSTGTFFIWGAQLELGAYPTTYIPTTTASATRVADSFSRNNIYTNGLITSSGGTWFVELRGNVAYTRDSNNGIFIGDTASINTGNQLTIRNASVSASVRLSIFKYISAVGTQIFTTTTDTVKIAIKWDGTSADVFVNGTKVVSATSFTTTIMENLLGSGAGIPVFIQAMAIYPSPLSDTDCTTLTTL